MGRHGDDAQTTDLIKRASRHTVPLPCEQTARQSGPGCRSAITLLAAQQNSRGTQQAPRLFLHGLANRAAQVASGLVLEWIASVGRGGRLGFFSRLITRGSGRAGSITEGISGDSRRRGLIFVSGFVVRGSGRRSRRGRSFTKGVSRSSGGCRLRFFGRFGCGTERIGIWYSVRRRCRSGRCGWRSRGCRSAGGAKGIGRVGRGIRLAR